MTTLPTLLTKKMPLLQVPELISNILTHSSKMKQIDREYTLAKREMTYQYNLEKEKLDNSLEEFKIMAHLTKQQFDYGHIERMEILKSVAQISKSMRKIQDSQSIASLKETINILLGSYQQNITQVKSLQSTQNKMIGGR